MCCMLSIFHVSPRIVAKLSGSPFLLSGAFSPYWRKILLENYYPYAPVTPFRANLTGKFRGTFFAARSSLQKARACKYFTQILPGLARKYACKSDLPTDKFWTCSKRVSCGYLHADVIGKHQQEVRKGRNLLVYNPLKDSWLAMDL